MSHSTGWIATKIESFVFDRPDTWTVEPTSDGDGTLIYLQSDAVSFGVVAVYPIEQNPQDVVDQITDTLRSEHPGLELDPSDESNPPNEMVAVDGMFMTLDTVAYCWIKSWRLADRTVLVFVQAVEKESAASEETFAGICRSFRPAGEPSSPKINGRQS